LTFLHNVFDQTIPDVSSSSNEPGWLLAMTIPDVSSNSNEPGWLLAMTIPDVSSNSNEPGWLLAMTIPAVSSTNYTYWVIKTILIRNLHKNTLSQYIPC
jgi:hypothetical protein